MSRTPPADPRTGTPWWKESVVYQIYPRSFADSNGDGIGDIRGIIDHVDHLAGLGVEIVWLSPFCASPMDDNGYDISDYCDVAPEFGTLADVDELIAALHERGMKFVMDLVVNHTSDEHPWFVESRSSVDNPKRDWYWWRPARPGRTGGDPGAEPTNWESHFSDSAWEWDERTGEYYLHLFSAKQPDLNWENPEVRRAVYSMMTWWLDRGVDGFRMDVINFISKTLPLTDVDPRPGETYGSGYTRYANGPRIHEFLHELHGAVAGAADKVLITVGEMPGTTVEQARLYSDPSRGEVDMIFQFEHVGLEGDPARSCPVPLPELKANLDRWQRGLADVGWNSLYWDNHDQPRAVSRFGNPRPPFRERSAKALATVLHAQQGTPYVYQGEELGMTNSPFASIEEYQDIEARHQYRQAARRGDADGALRRLAYRSRDHARTPMQWTAGEHAGFTTGTPWLAVNPDHTEVNAAAQVDDPTSVLAHYRALIALRRHLPVLVHGRFELLLPEHDRLFCFTRTTEDDQLLVAANFADDDTAVDRVMLDGLGWASGTTVLGSYPDTPGWSPELTLRAWEAVIYRRG